MTIDFYIIEQASVQQCLHLICRWIEKKYADSPSLYIHVQSQEEAERMDTLLWTYRDDSFLPHAIYVPSDSRPSPIHIGCGKEYSAHQKTLLNLSREIPDFYQHFTHLIEIVFPDPPMQQLARDRYRHYRDQGHEINTHKLKATEL